MTDYFIYYAEANIVCLVIFGIMLGNDLLKVDRQEKQIKYDRALIAFMLYFVSDAILAGIIAGVLPATKFTVLSANLANVIFMALITYEWLQFVLAAEQAPQREGKLYKTVSLLPFLVSMAALIVTYLISPHVILDEQFALQPVYYAFQITVPIIYIAAVFIYTMRRARREESPIEKRKHLGIGFFPLTVIAGGLLQVVVLPNTPIFCFSCTILMLIFYIQAMENQISVDPLTGLNNRGQLLRYISQSANLPKEGRRAFVMMIDVNDFKAINDTYGHVEGDRALKIIAESLREVVRRHGEPIFLARYGGDEFSLIVHAAGEGDVDSLAREIREEIKAKCREKGTPCRISVGIGWDALLERPDTFQKCMERADRRLYLDKEYCKMQLRAEGRP